MGKNSTSFKKGQGGKPKGAVNKTTKEARELFISIMNGEIEHIEEALSRIRADKPDKYLDSLSKLFQYTMPKQVDVTSDGEKITSVKVTYIDGDKGQQGT